MGIWIKENTPKNSIILSDPETIYLLSGFSGRESIIPNTMLIQNLQFEDLLKIEIIREFIFNSKNSSLAANYSELLGKEKNVLIVYSGRTESWLKNSSTYEYITQPITLNNTNNFNHLSDQKNFNFLKKFGSDQIYLYELNYQNNTDYYNNYEIRLVEDIQKYDNISNYAPTLTETSYNWYLEKEEVVGPVRSLTLVQYISVGCNPPDICWNITIPSYFKKLTIFILNLDILQTEPKTTWSYSKEAKNWFEGNFSDPFQKIFDDNHISNYNFEFYGRSTGKLSKLGLFIILGEF